MRYSNMVWLQWSSEWKKPKLNLWYVFSHNICPYRERLRVLVASRRSDARGTPLNVTMTLDPCAFMAMFAGRPASVTAAMIVICFDAAAELNFFMPPTDADLESDSQTHPYYDLPLMTRWYHQIFDAGNACDEDPLNPGATVNRVVRWQVEGSVTVSFRRRTNTLHVSCSWAGYHMLPTRRGEWNG